MIPRNKNNDTLSNNKNTLLIKLYNDLMCEFATEKTDIIFANEKDLKPDTIEIPLEIKYSPIFIPHKLGCKDGAEDNVSNFTFFLLSGAKRQIITSKEVLMLSETFISNNIELEQLQNLIESIYDTLYYFFEKFQLKLNSITLNFLKLSNNKEMKFVCFFNLKDDTLNLIDIETGKSIDNIQFLEKIYS